MSLQPKYETDTSTGRKIGGLTIPESLKKRNSSKLSKFATEEQVEQERQEKLADEKEKLANHALSFMLCGSKARWKQLVAYHFTRNSFDAIKVANIIREIIKAAKDVGLEVIAVTMDMSKTNMNV